MDESYNQYLSSPLTLMVSLVTCPELWLLLLLLMMLTLLLLLIMLTLLLTLSVLSFDFVRNDFNEVFFDFLDGFDSGSFSEIFGFKIGFKTGPCDQKCKTFLEEPLDPQINAIKFGCKL